MSEKGNTDWNKLYCLVHRGHFSGHRHSGLLQHMGPDIERLPTDKGNLAGTHLYR